VIVVGVLGMDDGLAVEVARRAAATGARTEVVGVAPPAGEGDRLLLELAAASIGHATVTRSAARGIEAADLELALRYLPDVRAIVLVRPSANLLAPATAAAAWSGSTLVAVGPLDADGTALIDAATAGAPRSRGPIVLEPPSRDPDGAFAGLVAALVTRLDAGEDPAAAWQSTVEALAVDPA
jgi:hypothetical protein